MSLSPHFDIKVNGEDRTVFMSYGLSRELARLLPDPSAIPALFLDDETQIKVLSAVLAKRKPSGKITDPVADPDDIEADTADIEALLQWTAEHVADFFVRSLRRSMEVLESREDEAVALIASLTGSKASASPTA